MYDKYSIKGQTFQYKEYKGTKYKGTDLLLEKRLRRVAEVVRAMA
jgi:hypothetical protein